MAAEEQNDVIVVGRATIHRRRCMMRRVDANYDPTITNREGSSSIEEEKWMSVVSEVERLVRAILKQGGTVQVVFFVEGKPQKED